MLHKILQFAMPDFLGIGAARSGTTWVWENLRKHHDIWTPETKEIHFFNRRLKYTYVPLSFPYNLKSKIRYSSFFIRGKILGKITGEFSTTYAVLPEEKINMIYSWIPSAKIIFIMRDPVLRAWSHAKKDFSRINGKPLKKASYDEMIEFFELPQISCRGNYLECLKKWLKFYNIGNIHICFTEEISINPYAFLKNIFLFLGVDTDTYIDSKCVCEHVHVSKENLDIPDQIRIYLSESLYQQNEHLELLIQRDVPWKNIT